MDFLNTCETVPGPSVVVCPSNVNRDENSLRSQENEVSSKAKMANLNADDKKAEKPAKDQKLHQKIKLTNPLSILPSIDDGPSSLKTDQETVRNQSGEVANNSLSSDGKDTKMSTKDGRFPLRKIKPTKEGPLFPQKKEKTTKYGERTLKRKKPNPVPISQMVMEAMKASRKRNGSSVEVILEYMKGQFKVNAKLVKRYVTRFLLSAVQKGIVEQLKGAGDSERFKIRKTKKVTKVGQKLAVNKKKIKAVKK